MVSVQGRRHLIEEKTSQYEANEMISTIFWESSPETNRLYHINVALNLVNPPSTIDQIFLLHHLGKERMVPHYLFVNYKAGVDTMRQGADSTPQGFRQRQYVLVRAPRR